MEEGEKMPTANTKKRRQPLMPEGKLPTSVSRILAFGLIYAVLATGVFFLSLGLFVWYLDAMPARAFQYTPLKMLRWILAALVLSCFVIAYWRAAYRKETRLTRTLVATLCVSAIVGGYMVADAAEFRTPLSVAAAVMNDDREGLRWLLSRNADVNNPHGFWSAPLSVAAESGRSEVVQLLLEKGADPNNMDENGLTALWYAAKNADIDSVSALLAHDADPNLKGENGQPPLVQAIESGRPDLVQILLDHGADPQLEWGRAFKSSALQDARQNGDTDLVALMEAALRDRAAGEVPDATP